MPHSDRTELHFHLLPGVDDGPPGVPAALALAELAVADGTGRVVTTPHVRDVVVAEIPDRVRALREELTRAGLPLSVEAGGELAPEDLAGLSPRALETIAHGPAGRRWVLLEAPLDGETGGLHAAAGELRQRGYGVLLAHPERCSGLHEDGGRGLRLEIARGSRLQVNASSVLGRHGSAPRERSERILRAGLASALASDAHSSSRPPCLSAAVAVVATWLPEANAARLAAGGPAELLEHGIAAAVERRRPGRAAA